jgi:hypothetical protein
MWLKLANGQILNAEHVRIFYTQQSGSNWEIVADLASAEVDLALNGSWASQADALDAINRLVRVTDPADFA